MSASKPCPLTKGRGVFFRLMPAAVLLTGCQTYSPAPLPESPTLAAEFHAKAESGLAERPASLNFDQAAMLAVLNNPDLKASAARFDTDQAKAYAALLPPDPQLGFSLDFPLQDMAGLFTGYAISPSMDLAWLLTRSADMAAAERAGKQGALALQWQSWQVAARARDLFIQLCFQDEKLVILNRDLKTVQTQYDRQNRAMQSGDVTLDAVNAALTTVEDIHSRMRDAQAQRLTAHDDLAALMGFRPDVEFTLAALPATLPRALPVDSLLAQLPERRPDLLALREGYKSQDAALRAAILSQFPLANIGMNYARDTSDVKTLGPSFTFSLPIFNRGRGQIAVARATRAQLRAEYQARLDQAAADAISLHRDIQLQNQQIPELEQTAARMSRQVEAARSAYENGDLEALKYSIMQRAFFDRQTELIDRKQALWRASNVMSMLLGGDMGASGGPSQGTAP